MTVKEAVDATKSRIDAGEAWTLLKGAKTIAVAKGKKVQKFVPEVDEKELILQQAMGPSGNLRAPTYRAKDHFVIGFNADLYEEWVK